MIYLIITTSIINKFFSINNETKRKEQYLSSITDTLRHLPEIIIPIIVENNGKRDTYLDHFLHYGRPVRVIYTNNNNIQTDNKSTIEMIDIKEVIHECDIQANDIIIKLTGRYRMISPTFFTEVIEYEKKIDAFVKFYNVSTMKFEDDDCVLGCFALRAYYLQGYPHWLADGYRSAEKFFAKYVKRTFGIIREIQDLGLECNLADSNTIYV